MLKPEPVLPPCPADRRKTLETIAGVLRRGTLSDSTEDLAAWVAGVEIVEGLERAGFTVVQSKDVAPDAMP